MLTTMDVIIGKWKEKFPFLKLISPGNFPINVHKAPMIIKITPINKNIFPICIMDHLFIPKCVNAFSVAIRPLGVRWINPICNRYGS